MADDPSQQVEAELRLKLPAADAEAIKKASDHLARMRKEMQELEKAADATSKTLQRGILGTGGSRTGIPASEFFGGGSGGGSSGSGPAAGGSHTGYGGRAGRKFGGGYRVPVPGSPEDQARLERLERFRQGYTPPPEDGGGGGAGGGGGGGGGGPGGGDSGNPYSRRYDAGWDLIHGHPVSAADRFFGFRGRLVGGAGAGVAYTLGAASARNAAYMADIRGQTGGDAARAALTSNWLSRQFVSGYDTLSNREGLLEEASIRNQRAEIAQQLRQEIGGELTTTGANGQRLNLGRLSGELDVDFAARRSSVDARIRAHNQDHRVATLGYYDRTTVASEVAFREAQARQPIRARQFDLERERAALGFEREGAVAALATTGKERKILQGAALQANLRSTAQPGDGGFWGQLLPDSSATAKKRAEALDEEKRLREDIERLNEREKEQQQRIVDLDRKRVENARDLKQNRLELVQLEAQEFAGRADKAAGQAERYGRMNPIERILNEDALRMVIAADDPSLLPPDLLARAEKMDRDAVAKKFEQVGEKALKAARPRLQGIAPGIFRDDLDVIRPAAQAKANEAQQLKVQIDKEFFQGIRQFTLSDAVKDEFKKVFQAINENMNRELERQLREFRQGADKR